MTVCIDRFLLKELWPPLHEHLGKTGYRYSPKNVPEIKTDISRVLVRNLLWMLFEESGRAISRMVLECQKDGWMLRRKFFLGLPAETDIGILQELLANSRLAGCPPTMLIDKRDAVDFYQITFDTGSGAGWGLYDKQHIINTAIRATDVNIAMYEALCDGIETREDVAGFLTIAYEMYEAY